MTDFEALKTLDIAIAEVEWEHPMEYAIAFETAQSALRERIERNNGCECCAGWTPTDDDAKIFVWSVYWMRVGDGTPHYVKAICCPMCGRKLAPPKEKEDE